MPRGTVWIELGGRDLLGHPRGSQGAPPTNRIGPGVDGGRDVGAIFRNQCGTKLIRTRGCGGASEEGKLSRTNSRTAESSPDVDAMSISSISKIGPRTPTGDCCGEAGLERVRER